MRSCCFCAPDVWITNQQCLDTKFRWIADEAKCKTIYKFNEAPGQKPIVPRVQLEHPQKRTERNIMTKIIKHVTRIIATLVSIVAIVMSIIALVYVLKIFKFNNFPRGEIITSFGGFYETRFDNGWEIKHIGTSMPETCAMIYQKKQDMEKDMYNERTTKIYMKTMDDIYGLYHK